MTFENLCCCCSRHTPLLALCRCSITEATFPMGMFYWKGMVERYPCSSMHHTFTITSGLTNASALSISQHSWWITVQTSGSWLHWNPHFCSWINSWSRFFCCVRSRLLSFSHWWGAFCSTQHFMDIHDCRTLLAAPPLIVPRLVELYEDPPLQPPMSRGSSSSASNELRTHTPMNVPNKPTPRPHHACNVYYAHERFLIVD